MKVIFNGVPLASDYSDGGFEAVQGFTVDEAEQVIQSVQYLRDTDETDYPRYNRKRTLSGTIIPAAAPTLDAAMKARATLYDSLPSQGALVTIQGVEVITWPNAILRSYKKLTLAGVSYGFTLTFSPNGPGVPSTLTTVLGTGSGGAVLGTGTGGELGTGI